MPAVDYFSPVATFIALRETLEAGIIIAVLLGFIDQLIPHRPSAALLGANDSRTELLPATPGHNAADGGEYSTFPPNSPRASPRVPAISPDLLSPDVSTFSRLSLDSEGSDDGHSTRPVYDREALVRSLKTQVWTGALLGLAAAATVGAIFLYVFYTFAHDLWQQAENLWEGIFCGMASLIILVMGLAFLRLPHAKVKWRLKLLSAVEGKAGVSESAHRSKRKVRARAARGWILFGLPFITVLREGLEGVVFLGGIGMTDKPLAIATGAFLGFAIGGSLAFWIFVRGEKMSLQHFTTASTVVLFMMGAGLASRSAFSLERQYYINHVGLAAAESGDGPGSYRTIGNIWHFMYWNPEVGHEGYSGIAQLAQSLVGWNNTASWWTIGTYECYWIFIILTLIRLKFTEGRTELFGRRSKRGWAIYRRRRRELRTEGEEEGLLSELGLDTGEPANHASGSGSRASNDA